MNFKTHCECPVAGFCQRHGIEKSQRKHDICRGLNCTMALHKQFWEGWEKGRQPGQTEAVYQPKAFEPPSVAPVRGLGDRISRVVTWATGIKPCGGCQKRIAALNNWFPANMAPIEPVTFDASVRHLMFHVWPVKGYGAWEFNCDRLLAAGDLFNGRRIVAIAISHETDDADAVKHKLRDFTDEFIVVPNSKRLREVATWLPMLERLEKYQSDQDVTLACHGKCVQHKLRREDSGGSTLFRWTEAMYDTVLHWPVVRPLLEAHATVGTFRRFGAAQFNGWGPWHYSGTFFWFRNLDVFRRNWRHVPQRFYGTEAWPGLMFRPEEAGVILADNIGDLYVLNYFNSDIEPLIKKWRAEHLK